METIYNCLRDAHDQDLLLIAAAVCVTGVYASISLARHAGRLDEKGRRFWLMVAIVAAGSTAWATHMIGLLAFQPGMQSGFDPYLTILSLLLTVMGIGAALTVSIGTRNRGRRASSGILLGLSIALLHYLGQYAYLVTGTISWDHQLVALSLVGSLPLFSAAIVLSGERPAWLRQLAAPILVAAIALLHFSGMAAIRFAYDPRIGLPDTVLSPEMIAPIVAGVSVTLLILAFLGLRFTLAARAQAAKDRTRLKQLADLAVEGLAICQDGAIDAVNNSLAKLVGCSQQMLKGQAIASLLPDTQLDSLSEEKELDGELVASDGSRVPVRLLRRTVKIGKSEHVVIAIRDQRERLRAEHKMRILAHTDSLTGLSNRLQFTQTLSSRCETAEMTGEQFALLLLDLDRFKFVNDTFGHSMGDELLKRVAQRVRACSKASTFVARLGGDEFAVVVDAANAETAAENFTDLLSRPYLIDGTVIDIAASVGIALCPDHGNDLSTLSRNADLALYAAKSTGGSVHRLFDRSMSERAHARRQLELDLRRALVREEFDVYYQPQVDPSDGSFQGAEALVRWIHAERGIVSPADFIPLAEETGLISQLGEWVLRAACEEAKAWPSHLTVAVNLSPVQLRDQALAGRVMQILQETGLPPTRLELEITETALLQDETMTYNTLHALRAIGIRISMDDFGTGYSSLSYLRRFPFNKIKIDQSFVRHVPEDRESVAIIQAVTSLASKLNMTVTVEGVETPEQRAFTVNEGCNQIQGYLISRPINAASIRKIFQEPLRSVA
ncbi:diguanylate cyclase [Rhizobium sp. Root149]|uniref:bifunctional diguanylate cyclase/phosphodiesterase n=1 Tax=Rhizobium sp. Root149 TaxID=1736473 RepID=UPI00071268A4|nr:EAL domain-containing protein [Rhizobium sp. Root149]KQZ46666.1 diguanylate cyclase [Rhizobium sp. Root149]